MLYRHDNVREPSRVERNKKTFAAAQLCAAVVAVGLAAALTPMHAHAAGGAYAVDDVEIADVGNCKVESWTSFSSNRDFVGVTSPACVVDLGRPVEVGLQFSGLNSGNVWSGTATLKGKTNLIKPEVNTLGVALSGGVTFDIATGDVTALNATVPLTLKLSDTFKINVNGGWIYDRVVSENFGFVGAGFEWNFVKPLTLIGEVYAVLGPNQRNPRAQIGLRYTPVEDVDIDLIYGRNIMGEDADWITVGLNVRFNAFGKK
jgi:hypothetical protein